MSNTNETGSNEHITRNDDELVPAAAQQRDEGAALASDVLRSVAREADTSLAASDTAAATNGAGPAGFTTELSNIPFRTMIGGPLQAAVDAQIASSLATVDFINKVGFTSPEDGAARELVMVDFSHSRKDVDKDGNEISKEIKLEVPLLAMLPIPSLRIEHVDIDFNVKLNSVETSSVSDKIGVDAEVKGGWGPVSFKVSGSYQRQTATGVEVKKEYALRVQVRAVQDEMPAGLEKVLGMLAA